MEDALPLDPATGLAAGVCLLFSQCVSQPVCTHPHPPVQSHSAQSTEAASTNPRPAITRALPVACTPAGICDPFTSRCFCDGKYRRINPPKGSPPGTPALKRGRPLGNHLCQPSDNGKGHKLEWGQVPWEDLYGPHGWCEADEPKLQ